MRDNDHSPESDPERFSIYQRQQAGIFYERAHVALRAHRLLIFKETYEEAAPHVRRQLLALEALIIAASEGEPSAIEAIEHYVNNVPPLNNNFFNFYVDWVDTQFPPREVQ